MEPRELRILLRSGLIILIIAFLVASLLFGLGFFVARRWFPRTVIQQIPREIVKTVEKLVPGEVRVIEKPVYIDRTHTVKIPVEIEKEVVKEKPVVKTVTKEVPVPLETVIEKWPQTIMVSIGSVESKEAGWVTPVNPNLVIGMIEPGIYAVPKQPGWKIERVETRTRVEDAKIEPVKFKPTLSVGPTIGVIHLGPVFAVAAGVELRAHIAEHLELSLRGGYSSAGRWAELFVTYRF